MIALPVSPSRAPTWFTTPKILSCFCFEIDVCCLVARFKVVVCPPLPLPPRPLFSLRMHVRLSPSLSLSRSLSYLITPLAVPTFPSPPFPSTRLSPVPSFKLGGSTRSLSLSLSLSSLHGWHGHRHRLLHVRRRRLPRQALPVRALPLPLPALLLHELLRRRGARLGRIRHVRLVSQRRRREGEVVVPVGGREAAGHRQPGVVHDELLRRQGRQQGQRRPRRRSGKRAARRDQGCRPQFWGRGTEEQASGHHARCKLPRRTVSMYSVGVSKSYPKTEVADKDTIPHKPQALAVAGLVSTRS